MIRIGELTSFTPGTLRFSRGAKTYFFDHWKKAGFATTRSIRRSAIDLGWIAISVESGFRVARKPSL